MCIRDREHSDNPVVTERYLREVEKRKETHIESFYPGYLLCQDTFYVGTIKGLEMCIRDSLMAQSVINAVKNAESLYGLPSYRETI